jgi:hypothetical protein
MAWCRNVSGVAPTPAAAAYCLTIWCTRRGVYLSFRRVWNSHRLWGCAPEVRLRSLGVRMIG